MPIPRQFSFLGDSGNRGLHLFIPWGSGNLEPIPRGPRGIFGELDPLNRLYCLGIKKMLLCEMEIFNFLWFIWDHYLPLAPI